MPHSAAIYSNIARLPKAQHMEANKRLLERLFDSTIQYQVPLFQRPYVWKEDEHWEPLWDDIQALLDRQLWKGESKTHFLGAIVLEQLLHSAGSIETRQVIDGQQRFTTLQLLLLAAFNLAASLGFKTYSARFLDLVRNKETRVDVEDQIYKLWPTNSDRESFKTIHTSGSPKALKLQEKDNPSLSSNLIDAYLYFYKKLEDWVAGKLDAPLDSSSPQDKSSEERFSTFWKVIQEGLLLVVIDLGKDDDSQVIFETLNARGAELLPADLIKNYLFRTALTQKADVELLYRKYWADFDTDWWREEQGKLKRPRINLFASYYLTLTTQDEVKSAQLFNDFKAFVEEARPDQPKDAAGHIEQFARFAKVFVKFYKSETHEALARFLDVLEVVDTATVYPFLLYAYDKLIPDKQDEFDKILGILESFLMRRLITKLPTKSYSRFFVDLVKSIDGAGEVSATTLSEQLAKGAGDSSKFPTDDELRESLYTEKLYGRLAQPKVRTILEALDAASQSKKSPKITLADDKILTIEHVMPQTWATHWPLPATATTDPMSEQKATQRRNLMLNTLGNLTLITGSFNSTLQHAAWKDKRPELLKYGKLNLTQYFHGPEAETWDEDAIEKRTEYLTDLLLKIWPDVPRAATGSTSS